MEIKTLGEKNLSKSKSKTTLWKMAILQEGPVWWDVPMFHWYRREQTDLLQTKQSYH